MNKALLYYYYKDKETLYGAVLDKAFSVERWSYHLVYRPRGMPTATTGPKRYRDREWPLMLEFCVNSFLGARILPDCHGQVNALIFNDFSRGAGTGNRTRIFSLEDC